MTFHSKITHTITQAKKCIYRITVSVKNILCIFLNLQSMGEFNDSVSEYRYSLSLEPSSEPVLSVYSSVLCEMRKIEASEEYGRKLDETQVYM